MKKEDINKIISFLKPEFIHQDSRGSLRQLFSSGWQQINVINSFAGTIRGGHHHRNNREAFFVASGKFNLRLKADNQILEFLMKEEDFFVIEKNVSHSFEFLEDTLLVAFYDIGVIESVDSQGKSQIDMHQDAW
jgi:dTDP-4-dehydrorhamnose 3,5-epimerase-like enzyme